MTTYNPVRPLSLRDRAADFYWSRQAECDAVLFVGTILFVAAILVAAA